MSQNECNIKMLKTQNRHFIDVVEGKKKCETRINDRNFQLNDYLMLGCFEGEKYMDRFIIVRVTHVLNDFVGLKENYVILSIEKISTLVFDKWNLF